MSIEVKDKVVSLNITGEYTAEQLQKLLGELAEARAKISDDPMTLENQHIAVRGIAGMPYWTEFKADLNLTLFAFRDPGMGWTALLLSPADVARLIGFWSAQLTLAMPAATDPAQPTDPNHHPSGGGMLH